MKKYYAQVGIMWGIRLIAVIAAILSLVLGVAINPNAFLLLIFAVTLYLMSYIGYISRIVIYDDAVEVKMPGLSGKYLKSQLKEIVVYGYKFSFGRTNIDLYFENTEGIKKGIRTQSNVKLLKEILKDFNGKIRFETNYVEKAKEQMLIIGGKSGMFD